MSEREINIVNLPDHILEQIFMYEECNAKRLRAVCKRFRKVFEDSPKLMKNLQFNISKAVKKGLVALNGKYQALTFKEIDFSQFQLISNYNIRDLIKSINITTNERDIKVCAVLIQHMLSSFQFLKEISFFITDDDFDIPSLNNIKFSILHQPKLESLIITYDGAKTNVLEMFSNIPSIKKLFVNPFKDRLQFPDVEWKLEELTLVGYRLKLDHNSFIEFLQNQKSSLKVLRIDDASEYTSYIMKNLPNLEKFSVQITGKEDVDKTLAVNEKLRSLQISHSDPERDEYDSDGDYSSEEDEEDKHVGEVILSHYRNIKCLHVYSLDYIDLKLINDLELNNLSHLILHNCITNLFVKAKMPNLKFLAVAFGNTFSTSVSEQVHVENLINIEALTIYDWDPESIPDIIEKCPNLKHLNLASSDYLEECYSISDLINEIAPAESQLAILGIDSECISYRDVTYMQLLSEIKNKRIVIRLYNGYGAMNYEYWDPNDYAFNGVE